MATPTIPNGEEYFFPIIYEGNGGGQRVGKFVPFTDNGTIDNSLIFNHPDEPDLSRTPSSGGDRRTFTISAWIKLSSEFGQRRMLFSQAVNGSIYFLMEVNASNQLLVNGNDGTPIADINLVTNRTFEDTSKFYHVMLAVDTTQSTASDRVKLYVDGDQITSFSTETYPTQNYDTQVNHTVEAVIGNFVTTGYAFDGYMAEVNLVDGTALTPSTFGVTDTSTGRWIPKTLSGITYGTNGFRLKFQDSSALGDDTSGNGNDFTATNLASTDQTTDSPTQNFPTFSISGPYIGSQQSAQEGNLKIVMSVGSGYPTVRTLKEIPQSGKWYWEVKAEQVGNIVGIQNATYGVLDLNIKDVNGLNVSKPFTRQIGGMGLEMYSGAIFTGLLTSAGQTATDFTIGSTSMGDDDYIVFAFDMDNGKAWWGWNDSSAGSSVVWFANDGGTDGDPSTGANPTVTFNPSSHRFVPAQGGFAPGSGYSANFIYNFGSKAFAFTAPTGFNGLSQNNFPETAKGVSGLVWTKNRDSTDNHQLYDSSRGKQIVLASNALSIESTVTNGLQRFLAGGQQIEDNVAINTSGESFVSWNWVANSGTTATNNDGSLTSTVQVNSDAGFSIVQGKYFQGTLGHGLSQTPDWIIYKELTNTNSWYVYHKDLTSTTYYLFLNSTAAQANYGSTLWAPTSSTFSTNLSLGGDRDAIAYCWHEVEGFSKFGSYTGNGNADGPFVYTGFKPAWVMTKRTNDTSSWVIFDSTRSKFNQMSDYLLADSSAAEVGASGTADIDFVSNGFKLRSNPAGFNASGDVMIYMAFAEHPFVGDGTSPVTAR